MLTLWARFKVIDPFSVLLKVLSNWDSPQCDVVSFVLVTHCIALVALQSVLVVVERTKTQLLVNLQL